LPLELFNTLTGKLEPLFAADGHTFRFYCCGPTVYDYGHIGNFRTFLHIDLLRRVLLLHGFQLKHVMNITDVDDKIIRNAAAAGQSITDFSRMFETAFFEDSDALSILKPEAIARATENIDSMVALIQQLAAQDIAYRAEDGSWYFRIARFPRYGELSGKDLEGIQDGARIDLDEYEKDAARDFALWKATKTAPDGTRETSWDTPLGPGRPGWHIECSAMAMKFLGPSFDLHAGGEDLMFPHHENEIAQSEASWMNQPEASTHAPFARHWFHVRFLLVEGRKMSKSEGNFYTLRDLLLKGKRASAIRFLLLSVPYRHQLNFTEAGLQDATNAVERLRTFQRRMKICSELLQSGFDDSKTPTVPRLPEQINEIEQRFISALANDLNTAEAVAAIFDMVRLGNAAGDSDDLRPIGAARILEVLAKFDRIFAVLTDNDAQLTKSALAWAESEGRLAEASPEVLAKFGVASLTDAAIDALVDERTQAKRQRNFARADAIRNELLEKGILLEDSKEGVRWKRS
jgi:cysteinyl-tRNA synthetase